MQCRTHPTTPAYNNCNQCGDWLCEECTVDVQGRKLCRGCLNKLANEPYNGTSTHHPVVHGPIRQISKGALLIFSLFFPPGVNYMFMGLIKRGLAAMCGFFLLIYLIGMSSWPLTLLFGLAMPIYVLTCIFDGFNIRRRILSGEVVGDNIDGAIDFVRRNRVIALIILVIVGFNVLFSFLGVLFGLVRWLMPLLIVVAGLYLLLRNRKPPEA